MNEKLKIRETYSKLLFTELFEVMLVNKINKTLFLTYNSVITSWNYYWIIITFIQVQIITIILFHVKLTKSIINYSCSIVEEACHDKN